LEHLGDKVAHDGMGLDVEVSHHDFGLQAADELDDVVIYLCAQEYHDTTSMQGAG
jgi:hypothetical protein